MVSISNCDNAISQEQFFMHKWYFKTVELELISKLLKLEIGNSLLDIGCGPGFLSIALSDVGFKVSGIDSSPCVIKFAKRHSNKKIKFYHGMNEDLPFVDNAFNHVCLFRTLEFVNNYRKVLKEACRVAKDSVFIGALNKYSLKGIRLGMEKFFTLSLYSCAQLFSVWELCSIIREIIGPVLISWRTLEIFPNNSFTSIKILEKYNLVHKFPFGTFIGLLISLTPIDLVTPIRLGYDYRELPVVIVN